MGTLPVPFKIINCSSKKSGIVVSKSENQIAFVTQDSTNFSSRVTVIDAKLLFSEALTIIDPADRAFSILICYNLFVLFKRQSISMLDLDLEIDSGFFLSHFLTGFTAVTMMRSSVKRFSAILA